MLRTIIKRSGQQEDFSNKKANGWMIALSTDLEGRIDWTSIITAARMGAPETMTSQEWQQFLVDRLKARGSQSDGWPYMVMAGRLYAVLLMKRLHGDDYPHLQAQLENVAAKGLMRTLDYSQYDLDYLNNVIDHEANLQMAYSQVEQYYQKYALRDRTTHQVYETPQFTMMRMAMAVHEGLKGQERLDAVTERYLSLRDDTINPPTPSYSSLGTDHYGMASCCLIAASDDAQSLKVADTVIYNMTLASAGVGIIPATRSPNDPVDGGRVAHAGRLGYIRMFVESASANKQGMRGGALAIYHQIFDPEAEMLARLQNPRTPVESRNRRVNVAYQTNKFFCRMAASRKKVFTYNQWSAPDLWEAFYQADETEFERLYNQYEANPLFKKNYVDAFDLLLMHLIQEQEVSTLFWNNTTEMNIHTPFKGTLYSSNLCMEVMVTTAPWKDMRDLYGDGHPSKGETGICNIGSIAQHNLPFDPNNPLIGYAEYKKAVRSMLEMIAYSIDNSDYKFPAISAQAKARRNASVGMSGIGTLFAQLNLKLNSPEGRAAWHRLNERHAFACIEVALEMGMERGNAPWMNGPDNDGVNGTKWVDGWMPIDTYNKNVDELADSTLFFDWEVLRKRVVANKGIYFSCLIAHMPGEQSTRKGTGSNSVYPLFELSVDLTDGSSAIPWAAKNNDLWSDQYQMVWDMSHEDIIAHYAICQKFTDQGISADMYVNRSAGQTPAAVDMVKDFLLRVRYGLKSKYYSRIRTQQQGAQKDIEIKPGATSLLPSAAPGVSGAMSAMDRIAAAARAAMAGAQSEDDGLGAEAFAGCEGGACSL